jgi:quercetin dioxygenase-like cupin family protein
MVCGASQTQSAEKPDLVASAQDGASSPSAETPQTIEIVREGPHFATKGPAQYFTAGAQVDQLFHAKGPSRVSGGVVTFEPGARSAWRTHPSGQILIVTLGIGKVQAWGGPVQEIRAGDVVRIPPHVKHWHGASPTTAMTHLDIQEALFLLPASATQRQVEREQCAPIPAADVQHSGETIHWRRSSTKWIGSPPCPHPWQHDRVQSAQAVSGLLCPSESGIKKNRSNGDSASRVATCPDLKPGGGVFASR